MKSDRRIVSDGSETEINKHIREKQQITEVVNRLFPLPYSGMRSSRRESGSLSNRVKPYMRRAGQ